MDILKQLEEGKPFSGRNGAFTGRVEPQSIEGDTLKVICDISKCKATCCYNAPLPKNYLTALKNRIVTPVKEVIVIDVIYMTVDHQSVESLEMVQSLY